jgi:alpha-tubulin suppressor-like RCC1 family protein
VALKADGTVIAWGDNRRGQASVPPGLSGVIAVSAGENHTLALLNNGQVVGWGANTAGQLSIPTSKIVNVVAIAAGRESSLAVTADGNLVAWGNRRYITFKGSYGGKVYSVDSDNQNSIMGLRDGGVLVAGNNLSNVFVSRTRTLTPSQTRTPTP